MDEQLKKMLLDAAQKGINGIEQTVDWIGQQAPELLEQLVMYNLVIGLIWCLIGIIGLCISLKNIKKYYRIGEEDSWGLNSPIGALGINIAIAILSFMAFSFNIGYTVKCLVAPKLFIFEYLSSLLK